MRLRLAGGVVAAPGLAAWLPRPRAEPLPVRDESDALPGAAVALGPEDAGDEAVRGAITALKLLVADGGTDAAGAGVELGGGFRSARLEGARGDQRDAVFAALKFLGVENAGRLGDRAGFLVALFGPAVTKRVGAAAAKAIAEGRWAALHLATAASDVLGPEQLERALALACPEGVDDDDLIGGGRPSVLAVNLRRVLEPVNHPRRLDLVLDLWNRVAERHSWLARRTRLLATQSRVSRTDDLRPRRMGYEEQEVLRAARRWLGSDPSMAALAFWQPSNDYWRGLMNRVLKDAFAATALLHTAVAVADHGLREGLARSAPIIRAAYAESGEDEARRAARPVPGLTGLPARPVSYVRDLHRRLGQDEPPASYVRQRLAAARDYGELALDWIKAILGDHIMNGYLEVPGDVRRSWGEETGLSSWRERVGYSTVRPPSSWADQLELAASVFGERESLATRLAARTDPDPAREERAADLLWCADLLDAFAMLHGHESAPDLGRLYYRPWWAEEMHEPEEQEGIERLARRHSSITSAVSGAAQLAALGGTAGHAARAHRGGRGGGRGGDGRGAARPARAGGEEEAAAPAGGGRAGTAPARRARLGRGGGRGGRPRPGPARAEHPRAGGRADGAAAPRLRAVAGERLPQADRIRCARRGRPVDAVGDPPHPHRAGRPHPVPARPP